MKRVLDSSVGIKWVIPEPDSAKAIQLLDDFHQQIVELMAWFNCQSFQVARSRVRQNAGLA